MYLLSLISLVFAFFSHQLSALARAFLRHNCLECWIRLRRPPRTIRIADDVLRRRGRKGCGSERLLIAIGCACDVATCFSWRHGLPLENLALSLQLALRPACFLCLHLLLDVRSPLRLLRRRLLLS